MYRLAPATKECGDYNSFPAPAQRPEHPTHSYPQDTGIADFKVQDEFKKSPKQAKLRRIGGCAGSIRFKKTEEPGIHKCEK
jgi:hypothetical protein